MLLGHICEQCHFVLIYVSDIKIRGMVDVLRKISEHKRFIDEI